MGSGGLCDVVSHVFLRRGLGQVVRRRVVGRYASVGRPADRPVAVGQTFGMDVGGRQVPRARPQAVVLTCTSLY